MNILTLPLNPLQENTYLVWDEEKNAVIIDAGMFSQEEKMYVKNIIEERELRLKAVLNTHLHFDHQAGNRFLYDIYRLEPMAGAEDAFLLDTLQESAARFGILLTDPAQTIGHCLTDGEEIRIGGLRFEVLHTPGHSPGSYSFYSADSRVVFTGDALFKGSIGRTDLPQGDYATLIASIGNKLFVLPDDIKVYCGHGPSTTIGYEKQHNPFF